MSYETYPIIIPADRGAYMSTVKIFSKGKPKNKYITR